MPQERSRCDWNFNFIRTSVTTKLVQTFHITKITLYCPLPSKSFIPLLTKSLKFLLLIWKVVLIFLLKWQKLIFDNKLVRGIEECYLTFSRNLMSSYEQDTQPGSEIIFEIVFDSNNMLIYFKCLTLLLIYTHTYNIIM